MSTAQFLVVAEGHRVSNKILIHVYWAYYARQRGLKG